LDINYFLEREQVERVRSQTSRCPAAGAAHRGMADHYLALLNRHRSGASADSALRMARG
jgi:hypothetical protein